MTAPTASRTHAAQATVMGLTTLAWYALPDVVRSRPTRVALKGALLGLGGAAWVVAPPEKPIPTGPVGPDTFDEVFEAIREQPAKTLGVGVTIIGLTTALSIAGEKAIFRFGERRRAQGVRGAHTVPALVLGALGAASAALP